MKEFTVEGQDDDYLVLDKSATFLTNTPLASLTERWTQGYLCLFCLFFCILLGLPSGHAPALFVLCIPVFIFLNEGFQNPDVSQESATRKSALEAFAKAVLFGPPLLALAEALAGFGLALICFGPSSLEHIFSLSLTSQRGTSFSMRLFREAHLEDPVGACIFALLSSLLVAGLCEESFKMGIGAWQVLRYKQHKKTLQPNVIMAGCGLGLAFAESVLCITSLALGQHGIALVASERVLTCFPIHVFCAVWTAKRAANPQTSSSWIRAVMPSALVHGLYDFGIILCSNYSISRSVGLSWGFLSALFTTVSGIRA
jgi:RsiW-degrading membrane proteinase PrsW (M82 family)